MRNRFRSFWPLILFVLLSTPVWGQQSLGDNTAPPPPPPPKPGLGDNTASGYDPITVKGGQGNTVAVEGNLGTVPVTGATAADFAQAMASVVGLSSSDLQTDQSTEVEDDGSQHVQFKQYKNGLEVVGGSLSGNADPTGHLYAVYGDARGSDPLSPVPTLTPEDAKAAAASARPVSGQTVGAPRLIYFIADDEVLHLAYEVNVTGTEDDVPVDELLYVDANSGAYLESQSQSAPFLFRRVFSAANFFGIPGWLIRVEGMAPVADVDVNAAYNNTGSTYNFYWNVFRRDSWNGRGVAIHSTVHFGVNYNDAFFNGTQLTFGDGDGVRTAFLARGFDVVAHEFTHGVTMTTARLIYRGESGALNEATSDIMAAVATSFFQGWGLGANVWQMAESVFTPGIPGDAARYMDDPVRDGNSRDWYPFRYLGPQDFGGVHINSGIGNLAFKLMTTGGPHPRMRTPIMVPAIGIQLAAQTWYRALRFYMPANCSFRTARYATARAVFDITRNAANRNAVHTAWDAVGVPR